MSATITTTRLQLIRHGESRSNAERWISGHATCGGLTVRGVAQAEALRARLAVAAENPPDIVLTSTMPRAVATAEIVASGTGADVHQVHDLSERTPGECEGLTFEQYIAQYGRQPFSDWEPALSPGGEDNVAFLERVTNVMAVISGEHSGRNVWIVCHGGVIMAAAALLMGTPGGAAAPQWHNPANTSVTEFVRYQTGGVPGPWMLLRYNDHAHLEQAHLAATAAPSV